MRALRGFLASLLVLLATLGGAQTSYVGASGLSSATWRFTYTSVNTAAATDTTNQYTASRLCCPIVQNGLVTRIYYATAAPNTSTPVVGETATNAVTIRCSFETPTGAIIQAWPAHGPPTGSDNLSIAAPSGALVWFDLPFGVSVTKGDVCWIRTFATKASAGNSLPLNINLSNYTTQTQPDAYDAWGDGFNNTNSDITSGGAVTAVAGGTNVATFGPCAVGIRPLNPNTTAAATFIGEGDSTYRGQSDSDSWRGGWMGREALANRRPFVNLACPGEASSLTSSLTTVSVSSFPIRLAIAQQLGYYVFEGYGFNDFINGSSNPQIIANRNTIATWHVNSGLKVVSGGLWATSTSTDNWSSTANESIPSYYSDWQRLRFEVKTPQTSGLYVASLDLASYLSTTTSQGVVPAPVSSLSLVWGKGLISAVNTGAVQITPKAIDGTVSYLTVSGADVALSGTDTQSGNYGNFAGGSVIVMTSGSANGSVFPVNGCNSTLFACSDPGSKINNISVGDSFNLVYQLSQNPHQATRQQIALATLRPMHAAVGL